jgi:hypothetical protein
MFNNNPLLKRFVDDLLCACIFPGLSAVIILVPRPSSTPTETDESPVVIQPSVIHRTATHDAFAEFFTASMLPIFVKAQ